MDSFYSYNNSIQQAMESTNEAIRQQDDKLNSEKSIQQTRDSVFQAIGAPVALPGVKAGVEKLGQVVGNQVKNVVNKVGQQAKDKITALRNKNSSLNNSPPEGTQTTENASEDAVSTINDDVPTISSAFQTDNFSQENNDLIDQLASKPGGASDSDLYNAILKVQTNAGYKPGSGLMSDNPAISINTATEDNVQSNIGQLQSKLNLTPGNIPNRAGNTMTGMRVNNNNNTVDSASSESSEVPSTNLGKRNLSQENPQLQDDPLNKSPTTLSQDVSTNSSTGTDVAGDVGEVADVAEGLEDATVASTALDETGVGLVITAGLGIASMFAPYFENKPQASPLHVLNPSSQFGASQ